MIHLTSYRRDTPHFAERIERRAAAPSVYFIISFDAADDIYAHLFELVVDCLPDCLSSDATSRARYTERCRAASTRSSLRANARLICFTLFRHAWFCHPRLNDIHF